MGKKEVTQYMIDEDNLKLFRQNLISSGRVSASSLGSEEDFVARIAGDTHNLAQLRNNLIKGGVFTQSELGNQTMFLQKFLKKNVQPNTIGSDSELSSAPSEKSKEFTEPKNGIDLSKIDLTSIKKSIANGDPYWKEARMLELSPEQSEGMLENQRKLDVKKQEIFDTYVKEFNFDMLNEGKGMSMQSTEDRDGTQITPQYSAPLPAVQFSSAMRQYFDKFETEMNKALNPLNSSIIREEIRYDIVNEFAPNFLGNLIDHASDNQSSIYDAGVKNPQVVSKWMKKYRNEVPGELLHQVQYEFSEMLDDYILANEKTKYVNPEINSLVSKGYSTEQSTEMVNATLEQEARNHLIANIHKKEYDRYVLQSEIDELSKDYDKHIGLILEKQAKLAKMNKDIIYDEHGRRINMPDVESQAIEEEEINNRIDEIMEKLPNFKENLKAYHDEAWLKYRNLLRAHEEQKVIYYNSLMTDASRASRKELDTAKEEYDKLTNIKALADEAKLDVDAAGRMLFMNQNLANKDDAKAFYTKEFGQTWGDLYDPSISSPSNRKTTPGELMQRYEPIMSEMGYSLTEDDLQRLDHVDGKLRLARDGAHFADFIVKMAVVDLVAGAAGIPQAVASITTSARGRLVAKGLEAAKARKGMPAKATTWTYDQLGRLSGELVKAGYEGVRFQAAGGEFGTGAAFYGAGALINQGIPNIFMKNKYLRLATNALIKSPISMTASMESVAAMETAIEAMRTNSSVQSALHEMFGDTDELRQRIAIELALGVMFGSAEMIKAGNKKLFQTTPERIRELSDKALEKGNKKLYTELENMAFRIEEGTWSKQEARAMQNKYEWLKKQGVDVKELQRLGVSKTASEAERMDYTKIEAKFSELTEGKVEIYQEVLGERHVEATNLKQRALEKAGYNTEGMTKGEIDLAFETKRTAIKEGAKLQKSLKLSQIEQAKSRLKEIKKELKSESVEGEMVADSDYIAKLEKRKLETEVEAEFFNQFKAAERFVKSQAKNRWREKYRTVKKDKFGDKERSLLSDVRTRIEDVSKLMEVTGLSHKKPANAATVGQTKADKNRGVQTAAYKKLQSNIKLIDKALKNEKAISQKSADTIMNNVQKALNTFNQRSLRQSINAKILEPKKIGGERQDPLKLDADTSFMMRIIDMLFNKGKIEEELASKILPSEVIDAHLRKLDKYKETERMLEAGERAREEIDVLYEGKESPAVKVASRNAIENGKTREEALARRKEIEMEASKRELTEAEIMEYQMLNFVNGHEMPIESLKSAAIELKSIINYGSTRYKLDKQFDLIHSRIAQHEIIKWTAPEATDPTSKTIDVTRIDKDLNAIQKMWRSSRVSIESMPTLFEYMMSRVPGREYLAGGLHSYTDRAIKSNNDKNAELSYHIRRIAMKEVEIFGSNRKASQKFEEWRKEMEFTELRNGVEGAPEKMSVQESLLYYVYSKMPDQAARFDARMWDAKSIEHWKNQITEKGGAEAIAWADYIVKDVLPLIGARVNDVYRLDVGADMPMLAEYFPVVATKHSPDVNTKSPFEMLDFRSDGTRRNSHVENTINRKGGSDWYTKGHEFNDVLFKYMESMIHYTHYQKLVTDMNSAFRNTAVREVIAKKYTNMTNSVIDKLINDMSSTRITGDKINKIDKLRVNFVQAKLGMNIGLFPKQMMSINAFQSELSPGQQAEFMSNLLTMDIKLMKRLANSRDLKIRYEMSQFNRDIALTDVAIRQGDMSKFGEGIKLIRGKGLQALQWNNLKHNMLIMTKYGDLGAILMGGQAVYRVKYNEYIKNGKTAKEAEQLAYNDFVRAVSRTQQSAAVHDLSHLQRYGSFGKMMTMFQNTPLQYARIQMMSMTNMVQAAKQGDSAKLANAIKNFMVYAFVLPATFQMASGGFYLGDEDNKMLDDPGMLNTLLLTSMKGFPVIGALGEQALKAWNTGSSFDWATAIPGTFIPGMAKDLQGVNEYLTELIDGLNDPASVVIEPSDVLKVVNSLAQFRGIPTASLGRHGKGIIDYLSGRTDNWTALLSYSSYMRNESNLSPDYEVINKHFPENGGTTKTMLAEMRAHRGNRWTNKNEARLIKEYQIYNHFGLHDRHTNYLYKSLNTSEEKAKYMYDLYETYHKDKKLVPRKNVSIRDMFEGQNPKFYRMLYEWRAYGVIEDEALTMFYAMTRNQYKKAFEW